MKEFASYEEGNPPPFTFATAIDILVRHVMTFDLTGKSIRSQDV